MKSSLSISKFFSHLFVAMFKYNSSLCDLNALFHWTMLRYSKSIRTLKKEKIAERAINQNHKTFSCQNFHKQIYQ